jgi:hypothetical protein
VDYKIALVSDPEKTRVVHVDDLKAYEGSKAEENESESPELSMAGQQNVVNNEKDLHDKGEDQELDEDSPAPDEDDSGEADTESSSEEENKRPKRIRRRPQRYGSRIRASTEQSQCVTKKRVKFNESVVVYRYQPSQAIATGMSD